MDPDELQTSSSIDQPTGAVLPSASHGQGVVAVILLAALLSLLLRRLGRSRAAGDLRRWLPVLYTSVWSSAVLIVTLIYARGLSGNWYLAIWLLFLVVAFASVGWLRSVMSGVAISIEGRIRLGDSIRVGDVSGEVVGFGMRSLRLRGIDGSSHEIPNEKLVTEAVANLSGDGGDSACELIIAVPDGINPDIALDLARRIAILTPLASPRHRPEVFLEVRGHEERRYELRIRGYAFDAAYQDHYKSDVVSRMQSALEDELRIHADPSEQHIITE